MSSHQSHYGGSSPYGDGYTHHHHHHHRHGISRRKAVVIGSSAAVVAVAGGLVCTVPGLASSADGLKGRALDLVDQVKALKAAISDFDLPLAQEKAHTVQSLAVELQQELSGGIWNFAQIIPVYGEDVKSVRSLVDIVVDLSDNALVPLCDALATTPLSSLVVTGDNVVSVDLVALQGLFSTVSSALAAIKTDVALINGLGTFQISQLNDAVAEIQDSLAPYLDKFEPIDQIMATVPRMLGSESARTYLVVAQANCEIRSTGGFPGSMGLLTVENGTVTMGDFVSMYTLMPRDSNLMLPITDEEAVMFGSDISWYAGIMNDIPHFPRVSEMFTQECAAAGIAIDGVVALDPVFLQWMMALCGSVTMDDGTLIDGTNAAQVLMSDVYWRFVDDNESQDAFFSEAAQLVFDHILANLFSADIKSVADVVKNAMDTRRLTVWVADERDEATMSLIGCAGTLGTDPTCPQTGIYLGNDTWGKIDWWLDTVLTAQGDTDAQPVDLTYVPDRKMTQVGGTTHITYTFKNLLADENITTNGYVFGNSPARRQDGDMVLRVWLYAPAGGSIVNFDPGMGSLSGFVPTFTVTTHMGLQVVIGSVQMLPGEQLTIAYDVTCAAEAAKPLEIDTTPTCRG